MIVPGGTGMRVGAVVQVTFACALHSNQAEALGMLQIGFRIDAALKPCIKA